MSPFEFAMGLISIIVGLAVTDIAVSAHRLIRAGKAVHWDARVVLSAALSFLVVLQLWFMTWTIRDLPTGFSFPLYLVLLTQLFVVFLVAAACLPDEPVTDLGGFYIANARYLWSSLALVHLFNLGLGAYFVALGGEGALRKALPLLALYAVPPVVSVVLALRPASRWLHLIGGAALMCLILALYAGRSLEN